MTDKKTDKQGATPAGDNQSYDRLSMAFESSARRWELVVYPSLFAFVILAAYGFYLVYSLAKDVHFVAITVDRNMTVLADNMQTVSRSMNQLTANVRSMTVSIESINNKVANLGPMRANMQSMDQAIRKMTAATQSMTVSTHRMQRDMHGMNRNTRPMNFMNSFMPW